MEKKDKNNKFLDSLFNLDKAKSKKKKKRDKKLKQKKKEEKKNTSTKTPPPPNPKEPSDPSTPKKPSSPKISKKALKIQKIFDEVEQESSGTQYMSTTIDPYKKLNIKRDSKAPSAGSKIKSIMDPAVMHLYDSNFRHSAFLLENYIGPTAGSSGAVVLRKKKSFRGVLKPSKSDIKRSCIFDIDPREIKFEDMIPMHFMWKEYIRDLLGDMGELSQAEMNQRFSVLFKVAKCDLHGAIISVFEAKNKCLIGVEGIVIKESRHTFTIICPKPKSEVTEDSKSEKALLKIIPKNGLTFLLKLPDGPKIKLYGNSICYRSSDRSGLKYKQKYSLDFF